jgi:hypothetical protein
MAERSKDLGRATGFEAWLALEAAGAVTALAALPLLPLPPCPMAMAAVRKTTTKTFFQSIVSLTWHRN